MLRDGECAVHQPVQRIGHLGGGLPVAGAVPVQQDAGDAADHKENLLIAVVPAVGLEKVTQLMLLLIQAEHGPLKEAGGQLILAQGAQQGIEAPPVAEVMLVQLLLTHGTVRKVHRGKLHDAVVNQGMEAVLLAAEVTVEGFPGQTDPLADIADGDLAVGKLCHQLQQAVFKFPLPQGAFFGAAVLVHGFTPNLLRDYRIKTACKKAVYRSD